MQDLCSLFQDLCRLFQDDLLLTPVTCHVRAHVSGEQHAQVNPVLLAKVEAHPGAAHTKTDAVAHPGEVSHKSSSAPSAPAFSIFSARESSWFSSNFFGLAEGGGRGGALLCLSLSGLACFPFPFPGLSFPGLSFPGPLIFPCFFTFSKTSFFATLGLMVTNTTLVTCLSLRAKTLQTHIIW